MVIPLLVCGYFVSSEWKFSEVTIADHVEIVPGTGRAQLIMADGRFLKLEQKENIEIGFTRGKNSCDGKENCLSGNRRKNEYPEGGGV